MPFPLNQLSPRCQPPHNGAVDDDDYGDLSSSSSSTGSNRTVRFARSSARTATHPRTSPQRGSPTRLQPPNFPAPQGFLIPLSNDPSPAPSRSSSPPPTRYTSPGELSSPYTSDAESEQTFPLLGSRGPSWWNDRARRWWPAGRRSEPVRRVLVLVIFAVAILVTLLIIYILNPDKQALPWRSYCSIPRNSTTPPALALPRRDNSFTVQVPLGIDPTGPNSTLITGSFPPDYLDSLPPTGLFLGVFSTDSAVERRMLIRSTWASHERSRAGAGEGDGGNGTSRTIVRFVLGKARKDWERRIQLEAETYNDMVELPISENMNSGKTHAFFTWAADNAWVPGPFSSSSPSSHSNDSVPPPPLAKHDPDTAGAPDWVRPDYVVKVDDDSFVMLAELEARLRVALDDAVRANAEKRLALFQGIQTAVQSDTPVGSNEESPSLLQPGAAYSSRDNSTSSIPQVAGPLVYWGYLVKNRFMAGELYALSWPLVDWVAREPTLRSITRGAEDKQTAKWLRQHPRAEDVRWTSERCWIYDHPRAGTVYSHGFLFPSEVSRVRRSILSLLRPIGDYMASSSQSMTNNGLPATTAHSGTSSISGSENGTVTYALPSPFLPTTPSYSYSSVSQFGTPYVFPLSTLTPEQSIEALVEGSEMSGLFEGGPQTAAQAWEHREGRQRRYEGLRVGGTVVVHFVKRNEWFLETARALLGGEDVLPGESGEAEMDRKLGAVATRWGHGTVSNRRWLRRS